MSSLTTNKTLLVVTGPTAVGKTEITTLMARRLQTHIISADARQFYREMKIGTAFPDDKTLATVPHHFIGQLSMHEYYNAAVFEKEALSLLEALFLQHDMVILTGGSGLYIDTLCHGIDTMPDHDEEARKKTQALYHDQGIAGLRSLLRQFDPEYYERADKANHKRLMRALEVCFATGQPYSSYRQAVIKERPFRIRYIVLNRPRHELFDRINTRVDEMLSDGLIEEAIGLFRFRHLNALNTVGYKEIFAWLANRLTLQTAVEKIKTNTRRYAKRQLTWFARYKDAAWFNPDEFENIMDWVDNDS